MFLKEFFNLEEKSGCNMTEEGRSCPEHGMMECGSGMMYEGKKPDFLDVDKDGNKVEIDEAAVAAWVDPDLYKQQRRAEYPSIADQLDTLYHGGYDAWKATIEAVKNQYPKPK